MAINDLEVWVAGTREQVAIALHGLSSVATLHYVSDERKLVGEDKKGKRVQRYVRAVPAARRAEVPEPKGRGKKKPQDFTDRPLIGEQE